MVTGKLDGAWRVVARSQGLLSCASSCFSMAGRKTQKQSGAKYCQYNEIDWMVQGYRAPARVSRRALRGVNSMDKPNGRLVLVSYTHYCASTSSLSTRWSSWALQGNLILERASRLYAFSGYHNRTSLPSRALGRTTGTQEVRPSRSSRTKDSPPQISYAHSR